VFVWECECVSLYVALKKGRFSSCVLKALSPLNRRPGDCVSAWPPATQFRRSLWRRVRPLQALLLCLEIYVDLLLHLSAASLLLWRDSLVVARWLPLSDTLHSLVAGIRSAPRDAPSPRKCFPLRREERRQLPERRHRWRRTLTSQVVRKSLGGRVSLGGERHSSVNFYGVVAWLGSGKLATGAAAGFSQAARSLATLFAQRLKLSFSLAGYQKSVPLVARRGFLYSFRWNLLSEKGYYASPLSSRGY